MATQLSKKGVLRFERLVLLCFIENDQTTFPIDFLWKLASKCKLFDKWEQKRAIEILCQLGVLKYEGEYKLVSMQLVVAIQRVTEIEREMGMTNDETGEKKALPNT